ncbi:MAG: PilN domain-containing protein [Verrucomicrobiota bacterium]
MPGLIAVPSPDRDWQLQSGDSIVARDEDLAVLIGRRAEVVVGIPSSQISTFLVTLPKTDSGLYESMIRAQIEKRGLLAGVSEEHFDFSLLSSDGEENHFAVLVAGELDEDQVADLAAGYAAAAELWESPHGGARIWREGGRLVLGIFDEETLLHLQVLSGSTDLDESAARELSLLFLSLGSEEAFQKRMPREIEVAVAEVTNEQIEKCATIVGIPTRSVSPPPPAVSKARGRPRFLPAAVTRARRTRRNKSRGLIVGSVALLIYLVVVGWLWVSGKKATEETESLERQISIVEPDVERIQQVEQRWKRLEPAFEKTWFPVVQLSRITSALPGSGVVVREYRTSGRAIRIRGQARDVQLANRLLEDLQAMPEFTNYSWTMPNPKVERNNTASFEIEGRPKDAEADS